MPVVQPVSEKPLPAASAAPIEVRQFRRAMSHFVTGVTVATTRTTAGEPVGVTINSFTSVSLDPPLVLFCLGRDSRSLPYFSAAGGFAVNVLAADQRELSQRFARGPFDWHGVALDRGVTGAPILKDCLAAFDCTVEAVHDGGDHAIFIGRVQRLWSLREAPPLVYYRSDYARLAEHE